MSKVKTKQNLDSRYYRYKDKFDSKYYAQKYKQFSCKLRLEDYERIKSILDKNNIGFTEFIITSAELLENKKIVIEKRLE